MDDGLPDFREGFSITPQLTARSMNAIVAAIRRNRLTAGPNQLLDQSPGGTQVWERRRREQKIPDFPFSPRIYSNPEDSSEWLLSWVYGTVNGIEPTIDGTPMSEADPVAIPVSSLRRAYLEISTDDALIPTAVEILVATTVPADVIDYAVPTNTRLRVLLTTVATTGVATPGLWGHISVYISINGAKVVVGL